MKVAYLLGNESQETRVHSECLTIFGETDLILIYRKVRRGFPDEEKLTGTMISTFFILYSEIFFSAKDNF